ncbi:MAG: polysaccharide biosynthesis protein [Bacteroidetes bacterium GWF2_42_66]|nr:MAG: polysaccharide biosynthesis protein [Bacteroidetes bacterium GWA2_42_15]OFX97949.1 MAG: polysaccharide biosynthesis protein [Bacteroidetes bacterium GWE2_42_39]OFY45814.1 MAG: polysaccharide biosynthesis protein [Bacteroidetes bacterium GWF2_42_66]HBL74686.1 polysaccharide biosynthesis protein [Prolixibacteraceae bacterium]HCR89439.1 polysaccharide biosynthesis protein [Prolixibacteraceae bacterium]
MGSIKKLAGDTAIYGTSSIIGRFLNWWLVPYYSRIFLPEEYGVVTNLYSYVAILLVLLTYGMETGFFRFAGQNQNDNKIYSTSLISLFFTSVSFVLLIFAFSGQIAGWIDYGEHPEYIKWMGIIVAIDAFTSIPFALLRLKNKALKFASLKFLNIGINIGANLFFLSFCPWILKHHPDSFFRYLYSPEIGVGYVFISNLIASIVLLITLLPEVFRVKMNFDWQLMKQILAYSFPVLIVGITGMINLDIDKILIPELIPAEENPMKQLGIYGANYKLAVLMNMFTQAFRYAFEPFFFSRKKDRESNRIYALVMKYFVISGLAIFLGMIFFMDIVKLLIDPSYHEGLKAVPLILMANLFMGIYFNLSLWYKLTDKTIYGAYVATVGSVITLALNFLLIPKFGYMGSSVAVLICFVSMTIISFYYGQKYFPINYDIKRMGVYFGIALVLYFVFLLIPFQSFLIQLFVGTILFLIFALVIYFGERKEIRSLLKK